jgi:demethylmenaquinone methyltransferase/2-methoxy-6-polyprenyl-1,4-benzoquinol methylase
MFGRIAHRYDLANRVLSLGIDIYWRFQLVHAVSRSASREILDLATGSGDVAFALARKLGPGVRITGMDFCEPMLEEARKRQVAGPAWMREVAFRSGDALELPLQAESLDAVTIAFGLRNMADRSRCLKEIHRVLRPGGRLHVLEFSQCVPWARPFYLLHLKRIAPWIAGFLTGDRGAYEYLCTSVEAFPGVEGISREILDAGFARVEARGMTFGVVALHTAVRAPAVS